MNLMKVKKVLKGLALGAALSLAVATGAQAGLKEANMFGASAQFSFWDAAAVPFLQARGCATGDIVKGRTNGATLNGFTTRDTLMAVCKGDVNVAGLGTGAGDSNGDTIVIRYSTHASAEGIRAVLRDQSGVNECADPGYRGYASTLSGTSGTANGVSALTCQPTHGGASDVAAASFNFASSGNADGPCGGDWMDEDVSGLTVSSSYPVYKPLAVPFAFFANPAVPFSNISRSQAVLIFSGQIPDWNFFKADLNDNGTPNEPAAYPTGDSLPITVCMRHAASGTQATLLASVMRGDATVEGIQVDFEAPYIFYNKGGSQTHACVRGECAGHPQPTPNGAIGVIDADRISSASTSDTSETVGVTNGIKRLTYNGFAARKATIVNGNYDFWGAQHLYVDPARPVDSRNLITDLINFASSPANISLMGGKANFWAAQGEMKVSKTNDFAMPRKK
jgi:hypothetical protein